jgi:hypothetical protein
MGEKKKRVVAVLRILLIAAGFGWGISIFGVFLPWHVVGDQLKGLGVLTLPDDPMMNYYLRMTSAAFTAIGVLFLLMALNPLKYALILPFAGYFMTLLSVVLIVYGISLKLGPIPFYVDAIFCLLIGLGIIISERQLGKNGA